jgi:hypothetical protein
MACSCQKPKTSSTTYVVTAPSGEKKAYKTEVEATAAAKRVGGTWKPQ